MKPTEKMKKAEAVRGFCFLLPFSFYSRKRRKKLNEPGLTLRRLSSLDFENSSFKQL